MANELQKKYGYIYCTTDLKNGMKYIGQKKSNKFIQTYFGSGTLIKKIIKKRPETLRLDLIEWCYSQEELNNCENNWTNAIGLYPLSYNLVQGGGTTTGYKHSEVTKIKISEKHKGQTSWNKGIKQSEETIEKRRLKLIGKKRTEEVKRRISEGNKGNKNCLGRILSEETRQLMSKIKKGKPLSEKNRMALKGIKKKPMTTEQKIKLSITTSNYWRRKKELIA